MDKQEVFQGNDCWICFDKENYKTLTAESSEKILKYCDTYLNRQIIIKSFENDLKMSCCSYCYESANQLILLEERIEKLQKEISGFSLLFSENVLKRRSRVKNDKSESDNNSNIDVLENVSVKKEFKENVSKELLSDYQVQDLVPDLLFVTDEHESFMKDNCETINPEEDIDIKYSCDAAVSNVFDTVNKIFVPKPTNPHHHHQNTIKTPLADLVKCLKMPVVLLERLQPYRTGNSSKIVRIRNSTSCITNSSENEGDMDIQGVLMNKSVISGKETIKREKYIDENKPYKCAICRKGFYTRRDLQDHEKLHNKDLPYICKICHKSFQKRKSFKAHELCHISERRFKCALCSKAYKRSNDLKIHEISHSGKYRYKCTICSKPFSCANSLKRHKMLHSGERPYKCYFCEESFLCEGDLKMHTKNQCVDRPYKCNLCEKSFKRTGHLKDHKKTHSEEKPHKCDLCDKSFRLLSNLRDHLKTHSRNRPHKCSFCSKPFKTLSNLKYHEKTHSTERPSKKCGFCEKSFSRFSKLKEHENIDSGEKPFTCSLCNKSCARKICLTQHVKQHHCSLTNLYCSFCSKSFKCHRKLKSHEISHSVGRVLECSNGEKILKHENELTIFTNNATQGENTEEFILP